jgi:hypothetical protein
MNKNKHQTVADPSLSGGCKSKEEASVPRRHFMYGGGANARLQKHRWMQHWKEHRCIDSDDRAAILGQKKIKK